MKKVLLFALISISTISTSQNIFAMEVSIAQPAIEEPTPTHNPQNLSIIMQRIEQLLPKDPETRKTFINKVYQLHRQKLHTLCENIYANLSRTKVEPNYVVAFDIDDTALLAPGNLILLSPNEIIDNFKLPANEEILELYKKLLHLGYKIVFVSARTSDLLMPRDSMVLINTAKNLELVGYKNYLGLFLCPKDMKELAVSMNSFLVIATWKQSCLSDIAERGYNICCFIDDNEENISKFNPRNIKIPTFQEDLLQYLMHGSL